MNIYFFCDRTPDPKMVNDLGGTITDQFEGTISNIYRRGNQITFSEALRLGGQTINICHLIPAESIVVVEEPILLQEPWLKAGIATLLILQTTEETGGWGKVLCKYCGLLQVHRLEVITSQWTGTNPTSTEKAEERMDLSNKASQKSKAQTCGAYFPKAKRGELFLPFIAVPLSKVCKKSKG